MAYKIQITPGAEQHLDNLIYYIMNVLCNPDAALNLLSEIEEIYRKLIHNPKMYERSEDLLLQARGYRKIPVDNYVILYLVDDERQIISIMGYFHGLENYKNKL